MLYINGAFAGQRVTGQQRYAGEVARRLIKNEGVKLITPPESIQAGALRAHGWAHFALPLHARKGHLLSLTARSPVVAASHILVVHDLFVLEHPEWYSQSYRYSHSPVLRLQLKTARALVAVSEPVASQLRDRFPRKRVVVAPNAPSDVFTSAGHAVPRVVADLSAYSDTEGFLFAVGSADPRKNFGRLLNAFAHLPEDVQRAFPLVIAGGRSKQFARVDLAERSNVYFIGYVTDEELAALYREATAVIVPSLDEGFGLPVVEALRAGARLAVSKIPAFEWIAEDEVEYFDPLSVSDMATAISALLHDKPVPAGPDPVYNRFDWETTARAILDLARSLD